MDVFIATILIWSPTFVPQGFAACAGQQMSVAQNQALFALIGNTFGGNGTTTFNLPDLRGRIPVSAGAGGITRGQQAGTAFTTLGPDQLPAHVHAAAGLSVMKSAETNAATTGTPTAGQLLASANGEDENTEPVTVRLYGANANTVALAGGTITGMTGPAGGGQPFTIMQPYLGLNFVIALQGLFPSQN